MRARGDYSKYLVGETIVTLIIYSMIMGDLLIF